jgi:hypothetical protein
MTLPPGPNGEEPEALPKRAREGGTVCNTQRGAGRGTGRRRGQLVSRHSGRGVLENKHLTDVESPAPRPRIHVSIHTYSWYEGSTTSTGGIKHRGCLSHARNGNAPCRRSGHSAATTDEHQQERPRVCSLLIECLFSLTLRPGATGLCAVDVHSTRGLLAVRGGVSAGSEQHVDYEAHGEGSGQGRAISFRDCFSIDQQGV